MPSSDPVPYPVAGRLYEATVKADALVGTVIPVAWDFNARAESGANYPALATVSNLSAAPIGQGGTTTGKVYFDVIGDVPNSVVFNNGVEDILGWIQPPGSPPVAPRPAAAPPPIPAAAVAMHSWDPSPQAAMPAEIPVTAVTTSPAMIPAPVAGRPRRWRDDRHRWQRSRRKHPAAGPPADFVAAHVAAARTAKSIVAIVERRSSHR